MGLNCFSLLQQTIINFWWIHLCISFLFIIALIIIIFFTILCILDATYRPNMPQISFNKFLDIICPFLLIINPTILIFSSNIPKFSFIEKVLLIIIIQVLLIIPIMYFWSKHRYWSRFEDKNNWKDPSIFLNFSIALIYPLFWFVFLSLLRYLRLGHSINIVSLIFCININVVIYLILITFVFWPYIYLVLFLLIKIILNIRNYFRAEFYRFLKGFHIYILRFNFYFKFSEILYKISFIIFTYIVNHPLIYTKMPRSLWRNYLHTFYLNKKYIIIFLLFCFLFELFYYKGNIYFIFFILFIYFLLNSIFQNLILFVKSKWAYDCCLADYIAFNWDNPRYPIRFWSFFPEFFSKLNCSFLSEKELIKIENHRKRIKSNVKARERLQMYNLTTPLKNTFGFRIKNSYMRWTQVRWTHTKPLHKGSVFFVRSLWEKVFFLNQPNGWSNYFTNIERLEKHLKPSIPETDKYCYIHFDPIPKAVSRISQVIEHNFLTNFTVLKENGVIITTFSKEIVRDISSQAQDDAIFNFSKSIYEFKKNIGVDQKAYSNPREGHAKVFSDLTDNKYITLLTSFEQELITNVIDILPDQMLNIAKTIQQLKENHNNFQKLQHIWANNLHHMPENYVPPLKVPHNFALSDLKQDFISKIQKTNLKFQKISDYLYAKNIPENIDYKQACELFANSELQQLMLE